MLKIEANLEPAQFQVSLQRVFKAAAAKIRRLHQRWAPSEGAPVFTVRGRYTSRGWTEWTQGFQFGMALLQFDASDDAEFLEIGRQATRAQMAVHLTHTGVHDHGFNNVSTYGNLLRLARQQRYEADAGECEAYRVALKVSGAVQASRWSATSDGRGYIYSFNGPHSLFADTIRSLRALALSHQLGHCLMAEHDQRINLLGRLLDHAETTARYNIYYGEGRDRYDVRGRVAHESIFNTNDGRYRCASSQQGYSPFTTWTRGHAWVLCGYAEQLEWLQSLPDSEFDDLAVTKQDVLKRFRSVVEAVADFYLQEMPADGIPYWDTGAPGLVHLNAYRDRPAQPDNEFEPVDSSAAAIAAQGLLRLGHFLRQNGDCPQDTTNQSNAVDDKAGLYFAGGLTVAKSLMSDTYLSCDETHEGLLLHSVYHHPNRWDHVPQGKRIPMGEACMWGDYHLLELAVYLQRLAEDRPYYTFFDVGC